MTFKTILCCLALTLGFALAPSNAEAQTYVRPSKGASFTVFSQPPQNGQTFISAVYDMSAFAELQLDTYATYAPVGSDSLSWNVAGLPRYVKISAVFAVTSYTNRVDYTILGSDTPNGTFTPLGIPGAYQSFQPNPTTQMATVRLVVTPLPYSTIQYTRPGKGENLTMLNSPLSPFVGIFALPSTPVIDMRGFAGLSVFARYFGPSCAYGMNLFVYGGSTPVEGDMRTLNTANAVRTTIQTASYVVNVPTDFAVIGGSIFATGIGGAADCNVSVTITPVPYDVGEGAFPRTARFVNFYNLGAGGADVEIETNERYSYIRLQNLSTGVAACGPAGAFKVIQLQPATAANAGNGGVVVLENYSGKMYCAALGGVATQVSFLHY